MSRPKYSYQEPYNIPITEKLKVSTPATLLQKSVMVTAGSGNCDNWMSNIGQYGPLLAYEGLDGGLGVGLKSLIIKILADK